VKSFKGWSVAALIWAVYRGEIIHSTLKCSNNRQKSVFRLPV
jgi:hypothetical protein